MIFQEWLTIGPYRSGRTTALVEAAKKIGATFVCFNKEHAQQVNREHDVPTISVDSNPRGTRGPYIFDHNAMLEIVHRYESKLVSAEKEAHLYRHMTRVVKAHGCPSITEMVVELKQARSRLGRALACLDVIADNPHWTDHHVRARAVANELRDVDDHESNQNAEADVSGHRGATVGAPSRDATPPSAPDVEGQLPHGGLWIECTVPDCKQMTPTENGEPRYCVKHTAAAVERRGPFKNLRERNEDMGDE